MAMLRHCLRVSRDCEITLVGLDQVWWLTYRSNSLRIVIGLKFGGMLHSTMK